MGSSTSMPEYYKENAEISRTGVELLRLSLKNIVQGSFATDDLDNQRLPFLQFYEAFYERLDELEEDKIFQVSDYFDHDVRQQTSFLVRILRLLIDIPEALINKQRDCKPTNPEKQFRGFISELEHFDMDCFEHVGSALLYAVCLCDEMHTQVIEKLWTDAYSIFLEHLFLIVKRSKLRRKKFDFRRKIIIGAHDSSGGSSTSEVDSDQELSIAKKRYFGKLSISTTSGFRQPRTFDRSQKRSFTPKAVRRVWTDHRDEQRTSSQYEFEVRTPNFSRRKNRSSRSNSPRNSISDDTKGFINRPGLKRVVTPPKKHEQIIKRQRSMSCSFPTTTSILDEFFCQLPEQSGPPPSPSQSPETRFRRNHMQVIGFSRSPVRRQRSRKHLMRVESPEQRKRSL